MHKYASKFSEIIFYFRKQKKKKKPEIFKIKNYVFLVVRTKLTLLFWKANLIQMLYINHIIQIFLYLISL